MVGLDDITKARIRRTSEAAAEPLDDAIEECALASIDYDRAFDSATTILCGMMRESADEVRSAIDGELPAGAEAPHDHVHAMAVGLVQKHIRDRTQEILTEYAEQPDDDDDGEGNNEDEPA